MCSYPCFGLSKIGFTPPSQLLKLIIFFLKQKLVVADAEIGTENCVAADPEISSQNCVVAIKKSATKTTSLQMPKSAAKTTSLPIQKSAAKIASLPIKKSAAKTESSILSIYILFFFWVFTFSPPLNMNFVLEI